MQEVSAVLTMGPLSAPEKPRLLDQVRACLRHKCYSLRTEQSYLGWIRRFSPFDGKHGLAALGKHELEAFLTRLSRSGRKAASTHNQALSALLFLYKDVLVIDAWWLQDLVRTRQPLRLPTYLPVRRSMRYWSTSPE